jgi:glycine hydroxymethyltransferase
MNFLDELSNQEAIRQKSTLNLIASENYPSPSVLNRLSSLWTLKYGEGYPGKRYYSGTELTDILEIETKKKILKVFSCNENYDVNIQTLSGSTANQLVYLSVLNYGDYVLSPNLTDGGHISHLHSTNIFNKFFKPLNYKLKKDADGEYIIDLEDFERKLIDYKPKLTIIGFSSYPKTYTFKTFCKLAHKYGSLVLADIAHISGLVATNNHDSPFSSTLQIENADFVTTTTHKTLRGHRSGIVFARKDIPNFIIENHGFETFRDLSLIEILNKTLFPGMNGGPHFNSMSALMQVACEILGEETYPDKVSFKNYISNVLQNTAYLEKTLIDLGWKVSSHTQNHLSLFQLPENVDSLKFQKQLEGIGIITNRNVIPNDFKSAWKPSGLRVGMAALTSRGINFSQTETIGEIMNDLLFDKVGEEKLKNKVIEVVDQLNWFY